MSAESHGGMKSDHLLPSQYTVVPDSGMDLPETGPMERAPAYGMCTLNSDNNPAVSSDAFV